jgi:Do/DeqQ family serine protease
MLNLSSLFTTLALVSLLGLSKPVGASEDHPAPLSARDIAKAFSNAFADIVEEVSPAVVTLEVTGKVQPTNSRIPPQFRRFFGEQAPRQAPRGQGSGFIVTSADGDHVVITNHHVIDNAAEITVHLADGRELPGSVIGGDPMTDLAVVDINDENLPTISLATEPTRVGEWVLAIGSPFGLEHTVTAGIVSAINRNDLQVNAFENFIQTDAAINQGNSGGPLVNLDGHVVGINSAILSRSGGNNGIGLTIPIELAKPIIDQLISNGFVQRGFVGIGGQDLSDELAEAMGINHKGGVIISEVVPHSGADKAGLQVQDVIISIRGEKIDDWAAFRLQVAALQPGTEIPFGILRNNEEQTITVTLGARDDDLATAPPATNRITEELGLQLEPISQELRQQQELPEKVIGTVIAEVAPNSPAAQAGLGSGMIITAVGATEVDSPRAAGRALAAAKPGSRVPLRVWAGGYRFVTVKIPE